MSHFDVAIIGGGLVGAALARNLSLFNIQALVIDNQPETALYSAALDNRGLALSSSSTEILQALGVWQNIQDTAYPIKTVHVSEQGSFGFTKLDAMKLQIPALGYVISASDLGKALVQGLDKCNSITVLRPAKIDNLSYDAAAATWDISVNSTIINAGLIIAADGTNSLLRRVCNIPITTKDYQQSAIICNVSTTQSNIDIAYERFTAQGVLALLPFGNKLLKCVWTVSNSILAELQQKTDQEYLQALQQAIGFRAGKFNAITSRIVFPIQHLAAHSLSAPGVIFIGNAANTMHPVAAQGFNLGLRDVVEIANLLNKHKSIAKNINNDALSLEYAQLRSIDHQNTQNLTNSLVEIFDSSWGLLKAARKLGLVGAQFIPGVRQKIIRQGIGVWR